MTIARLMPPLRRILERATVPVLMCSAVWTSETSSPWMVDAATAAMVLVVVNVLIRERTHERKICA